MAILKNTTINDTGYLRFPVGTTAQRPSTPTVGMTRYNTTLSVIEYWNGSTWVSSPTAFVSVQASGGSVTTTSIGGQTYNVHTFDHTGGNQTFTILDSGSQGVVQCYMWGAAGGGAYGEGFTDPGGAGGYSYASVLVGNKSSLIVQVGGGGGRSSDSFRPARAYPAGGLPSIRSSYGSGGGGGRSALFFNSVTASNALLIAGGGGGGAGHGGGPTNRGSQGGAGGGTNGESGYSSYVTPTPNGASQTAAGTQGNKPGYNGLSPGQLQGGDAGDGTIWSTGWNQAGGGGDGWWGGGAINDQHVGGGGGSGYYNPAHTIGGVLSSNPSNTNAPNIASLLPPETTSQFYTTGIGRGNNNAAGGNGKVVIIYRIS
jgi:hypothetical protein